MAIIIMWKYAGGVHSVIQMVVSNIIIPYVIGCHKYHTSYYITLYIKTNFLCRCQNALE
jgi:hypothetical protein